MVNVAGEVLIEGFRTWPIMAQGQGAREGTQEFQSGKVSWVSSIFGLGTR